MLISRSPTTVLHPDKPWEQGPFLFVVATIPDEEAGMLRMYYIAWHSTPDTPNALCVATSLDGRTWTRPDLGDGTNIIMRGVGKGYEWGDFMPATIVRDQWETDPDTRWKMVYYEKPNADLPVGICLAVSRDGLRWRPLFNRPIIIGMNDAFSYINAVPARPSPPFGGRHNIYQQTWKYNPELPVDRDNLKSMHRQISLWTCGAFGSYWTGPISVLTPDDRDPADLQFYWLVPFHTRNGYGGLLSCHHTTEQHMDIQLVSSRDGWTWKRELARQPLLATGPRGSFDCGTVYAAAQPVVWRGKVLLLYNGHPSVHDGAPRYADDPVKYGGIGLAELDPAIMEL